MSQQYGGLACRPDVRNTSEFRRQNRLSSVGQRSFSAPLAARCGGAFGNARMRLTPIRRSPGDFVNGRCQYFPESNFLLLSVPANSGLKYS